MKTRDLVKLSTRMFKARTSRTLLTVLGMGIGIAAILFLVSLGYGIQRALMEAITTTDSLLTLDVFPGKEDLESVKINDDLIQKIESLGEVSRVSPVFQTKAQVKFKGLVYDSSTLVVDPFFLSLNGTKITSGGGIDNSVGNGVVISPAFAKIFDSRPEELIGQSLVFSLWVPETGPAVSNNQKLKLVNLNQEFKVVGVANSQDSVMLINREDVKNWLNSSSYSQLKVKCRATDDIETTRSQINSLGLSVSALTDVVEQADKVFNIIKIILAFFGVIALIVSAIGMFNTMTVALLERTEEIGIMKSIGARDRDILSMFVFESMLMGFLGGVSGVIIGIIAGKMFNVIVNLVAQRLGGAPVSLFYFPAWFLGVIIFLAAGVGFLTGIAPAKKASSIDPWDALRYK